MELQEAWIRRLMGSAAEQRRVVDIAQGHMKTPDLFVTLCLTEKPDEIRMWEDYADRSRGFVLEFDTEHPGFRLLANPGRIGKVSYADEPLHTFLGQYGPNAFFRKRTRYAFEREWRSIRATSKFSDVLRVEGRDPIYLSPFDPNSVRRILVRNVSTVEMKLRIFVSLDGRYRHVSVESTT